MKLLSRESPIESLFTLFPSVGRESIKNFDFSQKQVFIKIPPSKIINCR